MIEVCVTVAYCVTVIAVATVLCAKIGWTPFVTNHFYPEPEDELPDWLRN